MYTERSQYRRFVQRIWRKDNEKHGEQLGLGKLQDFINLKLAHVGLGEKNEGYRLAMRDVTGEILRLLREQSI